MIKEFPPSLPVKKLLGPSFIILALGLGSGEIILWPYLVSNYGLGIAWGAILGITCQFFINMEIERYALLRGESVFVGISKLLPRSTYWFILSTFVGFGLPGIIAASAQIFGSVLGFTNFKWLAICMLLVIGMILSTGKTVYGLMEKTTKTLLIIGVPFIFFLALFLATSTDWTALFHGVVGSGHGFWFLPSGISLATFFAAFAYSGAGGNLNLTQSIYIKEKGYGMGKYSQKIVGLFHSKNAPNIKLSGENFVTNKQSLTRFQAWWRAINIEHFTVFLFVGAFSMLMLMLLSYAATFGLPSNAEGINFVINEGRFIGEKLFPVFGTLFLLVASLMLFQTQLGIMDSTSRIMSENLAIIKLKNKKNGEINLSKIYYFFVWSQILFGIILFLFNVYEPKTLIVLGAVINAVAMFVHTGLVALLNNKSLPKEFRPSVFRKVAIAVIFIFFGVFSVIVLLDKLNIWSIKI